ncbi:MAG TPA: Glu-tRNA(Gln) amidotransferase subunit GatE [Bacteroidales bacterium]|nr:Glu-tRNA(Gln) amidotransferase subunit GatE [Bacteroidales bacterium]HPT09140.1 Glu-tRNA(Gln) amidotransferase subunit GatE [Bacteroidales bacterium]
MKPPFDPRRNYAETQQKTGYVKRKEATQADYDRIGFMSGLEVHQQLRTRKKLFCRCPSGIYQKEDDFDAELVRHMRPTLSELGEYDGTALMEFRTRKNIIYRIKNETACTYEVDDTPPFPLNMEALDISIEIALLSKMKVVGEVHITRKQYLDGSIPTGFQRTAIVGVEGEIELKNKKVRLIQLSLEEDSCREVSDIGHWRVYRTDRLGMPLIETVTYPDFKNPDEVREGADYIRFLNRSTGKVLTGVGSTRADVNVSCRGGTRVEIKGVSHTGWMPELTHNEVFRQWALLAVKETLNARVKDPAAWKISWKELRPRDFKLENLGMPKNSDFKVLGVNLPEFKGILSHFTQPGKMFGDEFTDRLKVIACLEKPNMVHSEMFDNVLGDKAWARIRTLLESGDNDAQIIFWGPADDIKTALETIEERGKMAFAGVPNETRKSLPDGTTIFERVLPGADRMYPDTDSAPIPLEDTTIDEALNRLPQLVSSRIRSLIEWQVPEDTHTYILKNNLVPLLEQAQAELGIAPRFTATLLAHTLKHIQGQYPALPDFSYGKVLEMLRYLKEKQMDPGIAKKMLLQIYQHPKMDFESVLTTLNFKYMSKSEIFGKIPFLVKKYQEIRTSGEETAGLRWIMGNLNKVATGNISLKELSHQITSFNPATNQPTQ